MRVLFIGGTKRGYSSLRALLENEIEVIGVISLTQDAHEKEHYEKAIETLAQQYNIPHYQTRRMQERDYVQIISEQLKPALALVVGCRVLISKEIYSIPKKGTFAVHDSLLPEYRGYAPLNWCILNGEGHTCVTLFELNENMDGGDIIAQKIVPIGSDDIASMVYERICQATADLILETLPHLKRGAISRIKQDYSIGSFTCSRTPKDGLIEWSRSTKDIYNQVRGLTYPYPGAFTFYKGKKLVIWKAKQLEKPPIYKGRIPGRVIQISQSEGWVDILTGDGVLRIFEIQFEDEGQRTQAAQEIDSIRSTLGLSTPQLLERVHALEREILELKNDLKGTPVL